jgi:hypothetical protein
VRQQASVETLAEYINGMRRLSWMTPKNALLDEQ